MRYNLGMRKKILNTILALVCLMVLVPSNTFAQSPLVIEKGKVIEVVSEEDTTILGEVGYNIPSFLQTLRVEIIDGDEKGKEVVLENDYTKFKKGDVILLEKTTSEDGDQYIVRERDRLTPILVLLGIFIIAIVSFGGKQGVRSLVSLLGGFLVIIYGLLPLLAKGYSPILVSISFASVILFSAIFFTHGFNKESVVAFGGTILAVILTGLLAFFSVILMKLTGFSSEETIFLNITNTVSLNFSGLLLGGVLIGVLGILDDIAVTQAAVVNEIYDSAEHLSPKEIYTKAMRVGREHVSALVNTLVLAYTGASLPLLLLISISDYPLRLIISQELFATEIVRTIVGSIGLVFTVPITTILAVYFLKKKS